MRVYSNQEIEAVGQLIIDGMTVNDWLKNILITLLQERESFSGKRPLGDSSWWFDIEEVLFDAGHIKEDESPLPVLTLLIQSWK